LNTKFGKDFACDDDDLMQILNSPPLIAIAKSMVNRGVIDSSALQYRVDNVSTVIDESKFAHLNNFKEMLTTVGNYITKDDFIFSMKYLTPGQIKESIDNDFPVIVSGKFTAGGHFILIVGYDNYNWIVDDPYGDWNSNYSPETIGKGAKLLYNFARVDGAIVFKQMVDGIMGYQSISIREGIVREA